jgi:hypothetical protein
VKITCAIIMALSLTQLADAEVYTFAGSPVEIPPKGPANPSFLSVQGVVGVVKNISVKFNNVDHKYGGETMLALTNPNGFSSLIWDKVSCKFHATNLLFTDSAEQDLSAGCTGGTIASGTYLAGNDQGDREFTIPIAPTRPMFARFEPLISANLNGRWILWAEDFTTGDGGSIDSWEVIIETQ